MSLRLACVIAVVAVAAGAARAEHLPHRIYTTADGLGNSRVQRAIRDARGFLWFVTQDGLSRFDGDRFDNFGVADGMPSAICYDVLETRDGVLWVATDRGLARVDVAARAARARFTRVEFGDGAHRTLTLFEDRAGQLWIGSEGGLWRRTAAGAIEAVPLRAGVQPYVYKIVEDRDETLWLGTSSALLRRLPDGGVDHAALAPPAHADERIESLLVDGAGRLWIGSTVTALMVLLPPPPGTPLLADGDTLIEAGLRGGPRRTAAGDLRLPAHPGELVAYDGDDGFPPVPIRRGIAEDADGAIWTGTGSAAVRFDGHHLDVIGAHQGLPAESLAPLVVDAAGNLWLGGASAGLVRLARRGLIAYDTTDGLDPGGGYGFSEDAAGALYATTCCVDGQVFNRFDGDHFVAVQPKKPSGQVGRGAWGVNQLGFPDRDGSWWYATSDGVAHYPKVARFEDLATTEPAFFGIADGLPGRDVLRLYGDRRGDVWISTMSDSGLARWDRATDRIVALPAAIARLGEVASAFVEDRGGALWIGYDTGALVCVTGGAARVFGPADGLTDDAVTSLLIDHAGRLWIATTGGLIRVDDPAADRLAMVRYTRAGGLSSDQTSALTEDTRGRIHVGTVRGIDRIDPDNGEIGHLTTADGLGDDYVNTAYRDRGGQLWFGSFSGVARLVADDAPAAPPPPAYITSLRAGGRARPLALDGERAPPAISLAHDDGQLDIAFTSPSFAIGTPVQFQVRLVGADGDWSAPSASREVHYAHLAPGHYRFLVRSVFAGGLSSAPAGFAIEIRRPIWQRPWFVALAAAGLALLGWGLYRRRVAQLVAVERVRTRIATDLHDDLGSSLSRIAILSEVAARRATGGGDVGEVVGDIGTSARALVDVASDIVWSTDPRRDDLGSLLVRLRSFAGDVLEGRGLAWSLDAPPEPDRIKIGPDARRHLYLIVKEAIANAARHSQAKHVTIRVAQRGGRLEAIVQDDGRGLDAAPPGAGNGLTNMRARATAAGGTLVIDGAPGGGTRVTLYLPA